MKTKKKKPETKNPEHNYTIWHMNDSMGYPAESFESALDDISETAFCFNMKRRDEGLEPESHYFLLFKGQSSETEALYKSFTVYPDGRIDWVTHGS